MIHRSPKTKKSLLLTIISLSHSKMNKISYFQNFPLALMCLLWLFSLPGAKQVSQVALGYNTLDEI